MYIQTEGIILRQIKTVNGRRMVGIFTEKYGKVSCGTSVSEGGKNKTALALRPFTYGRYEIFKGRETYNIQGAETIKSFYALGEDIEKYMAACYVLELTDKVLMEGETHQQLFASLRDFFELLTARNKAYQTLVIAYQLKLLLSQGLTASEGLKTTADADIIEILKYMESHRLKDLETVALKSELEDRVKLMLRDYFVYHLGIGNLKSEEMII